jgi:Na+-transporting NADH:ubiquinone oxidoreductase subunit A
MTEIKIKHGLDIPIKGKPTGNVQPLIPSGESFAIRPSQIALDLMAFEDIKFRLLVKAGDNVKLGQPLVEDKDLPGRMFVAPAAGIVQEIRRGLKRRLLAIVIEVAQQETAEQYDPIVNATREEILERLKLGGLFAHIRQRPFNVLADPRKMPRSIFIKAIESAPLVPPAELQVVGYDREFQAGLDVLSKLTAGSVHLVYRKGTPSRIFSEAKGVQKHTVEGPHPAGNASVHIQAIDPILSPEDCIWTLNAHDVVSIGYFALYGRYFVERIISIAGPAVIEGQAGYYKVRAGYPIALLLSGKIRKGEVRLISGDVLTGQEVKPEEFLGFYDYAFCAVAEEQTRQFLHFMRLGANKYTYSGTYLSGHLNNTAREYEFTTSQRGEHRPFIDASLYDDVMPLNVSPMHLVKAILAEDYDLAVQLGLLEVDAEDFALPTFVDPSKIDMNEIVKKGLRRYMADILK